MHGEESNEIVAKYEAGMRDHVSRWLAKMLLNLRYQGRNEQA
jgi:hypothetical protein